MRFNGQNTFKRFVVVCHLWLVPNSLLKVLNIKYYTILNLLYELPEWWWFRFYTYSSINSFHRIMPLFELQTCSYLVSKPNLSKINQQLFARYTTNHLPNTKPGTIIIPSIENLCNAESLLVEVWSNFIIFLYYVKIPYWNISYY